MFQICTFSMKEQVECIDGVMIPKIIGKWLEAACAILPDSVESEENVWTVAEFVVVEVDYQYRAVL